MSAVESLRLNWIPLVDPGFKTAQEGGNIGEAIGQHDLRRTGAALFIRSSAVGDNPILLAQLT